MLSDNLKVLLASTNSLSIKAQNFHWNVEGDNFPQYHEFFGNFYEEDMVQLIKQQNTFACSACWGTLAPFLCPTQ